MRKKKKENLKSGSVRMGGSTFGKEEIAIHTEHLTRSFDQGDGTLFDAVHDVSLDFPKGKVSILKGRSGSGKTTLLNMLSTLDDPTSGETEFLGERLSAMATRQKEMLRRMKMGFVFQSIALIPVMSAYENVDFALRLAGYKGNHDARIKELMELVGLPGRMHHMPGQLSGGEQQRVAIARAVAHQPEVVFADEPTGALDTASGMAAMMLFRKLAEEEGTAVIMTTHDPNLMELGDMVYEMADGCVSHVAASEVLAQGERGDIL